MRINLLYTCGYIYMCIVCMNDFGLNVIICSLCTVDGNSVTVSSAINAEEKEEIVQFLLQTFDQVYLPSFLVR